MGSPFGANRPNELWVTDVTEFRIPAGKVYLSPIVDCFDGMPISWSSSTSPDAEMRSSLLSCRQLRRQLQVQHACTPAGC